jgi:hypothetical protein
VPSEGEQRKLGERNPFMNAGCVGWSMTPRKPMAKAAPMEPQAISLQEQPCPTPCGLFISPTGWPSVRSDFFAIAAFLAWSRAPKLRLSSIVCWDSPVLSPGKQAPLSDETSLRSRRDALKCMAFRGAGTFLAMAGHLRAVIDCPINAVKRACSTRALGCVTWCRASPHSE